MAKFEAQREAELLRRAKLFRHILLDGDGQADMKTAREVLKCEPEEEAVLNDVIRQVDKVTNGGKRNRQLREKLEMDDQIDRKLRI